MVARFTQHLVTALRRLPAGAIVRLFLRGVADPLTAPLHAVTTETVTLRQVANGAEHLTTVDPAAVLGFSTVTTAPEKQTPVQTPISLAQVLLTGDPHAMDHPRALYMVTDATGRWAMVTVARRGYAPEMQAGLACRAAVDDGGLPYESAMATLLGYTTEAP